MSDQVEARRFRGDDLRRLAVALGKAVGLSSWGAARLAGHLLWFESAGVPAFGMATLPGWLRKITTRQVDPETQGVIGLEHPATVVLDARRGVGPLLLARAAELAVEKAREVGLGFVRVTNLEPSVPAAEAAAEIAVGPMAAAVLGPGPSWTLALPTSDGLPAVYDTDLGASPQEGPPEWAGTLSPWLSPLTQSPGNWMVLALTIPAIEPLTAFLEQTTARLPREESPGCLLPGPWNRRRQLARERGVALSAGTRSELRAWSEQLDIALPESLADTL